MKTSKCVFFLGAGASAHLGIPVSNDFFAKAIAGSSTSMTPLIDRVRALFPEFRKPGIFPPLEDIYSSLHFSAMLGHNNDAVLEESLLKLMSKSIAQWMPVAPDPVYLDFVRFLKSSSPAPVVLSLNYDLALEFALVDYWLNREKTSENNPTEGIPEYNIYDYCLPTREHRIGEEALTLLKLHGSINWGICRSCQNVRWFALEEITGKKNLRTILRSSRRINLNLKPARLLKTECAWHAEDQKPHYFFHITPPTWDKTFYEVTLRNIWRKAEEHLHDSTHVICIGISFRDEDQPLRRLLRVARPSSRQRKYIYIVDKLQAKTMDARGREITRKEQHFARVFQEWGAERKEFEIKFYWGGFAKSMRENWIQNIPTNEVCFT